jgi:tRNA(His) 5'-end guanylyltransferase
VYRGRELYREARVEAPLSVRVDGVGWGRRLRGFKWPRDRRVHRALAHSVGEVVALYGASLAYVTSDEASIVWLGDPPYGGRVEKLVSVVAAAVSSGASIRLGRWLFTDGRVVKLYGPEDAARYLLYRARVGFNNYVSSLYHAVSGGSSTPSLAEMLEFLRRRGVDPLRPPWAGLGSCILRLPSTKRVDGLVVERRRLVILDTVLPCLEVLGATRPAQR